MSMFMLYVLFVLVPGIGSFCGGLAFILSIVGATTLMAACAAKSEDQDNLADTLFFISKVMAVALFISAILTNTLPTKNDMLLLVGASAATNIEGIEKLPPNIIKAMNNYLESTVPTTDTTEGK